MSVLEVCNIAFKYDKKSPWIFEDFSMQIESGERVGIIAPSGFGKSTLAKILCGYLLPHKGQILLDGKPLLGKAHCSNYHPIQLIYQHPEDAINPRWRMKTVLEECGSINNDELVALGIELKWLERFPRELSGGELQRFCVLRALASSAAAESNLSFIVADEITTMLDVITQAQLCTHLINTTKKRDVGLLFITHNQKLAEQVCDRILRLA